MNEFPAGPKSDFNEVFGFIGDKMQINLISGLYAWDLNGVPQKGDPPVTIGHAVMADAEDILGGGKWLG